MNTLIFDTETTDLVKTSLMTVDKQPHIIEFYGCVIDDDGNLVEELEQLIHPGFEITPDTTRMTGITRDMLSAAPRAAVAMPAILNLIEHSDRVVAHNLSFDKAMVDIEAKRLNTVVEWPDYQTCTVEASLFYKGFRLNLTSLHEHLLGVAFTGAHRAKIDVMALTRCFIEMRKKGDV